MTTTPEKMRDEGSRMNRGDLHPSSFILHPSEPAWARLAAPVVRRLPRGRFRAMNWLSRRPGPPFVARLHGSPRGLRFECDLRNALAREVFFTGRYEPQETSLVCRLLGPGGTFVDVGAHWGYFSLLAADAAGPAGRIVAVEADPRIHRTLARNFALNGLANAEAVHAAAAAEAGVLALDGFDEGQDNWGVSRVAGVAGSAGARFEVPARPVDALLDERGVGAVDLLKMDIEGAEGLALRGMAAGLRAGRYRRILIELHPAQIRALGGDASDATGLLLDAGYRGWVLDHSAASLRAVSYGRVPDEVPLRPFDPAAPLDAWPHLLWEAPGVAPAAGGR
jgi:FkbM family methyltransferase